MYNISRYNIKKYPNQEEKTFVSNDVELIYNAYKIRFNIVKPLELSLTPRYPSEDNGFIFTFLLRRHVINEKDQTFVDLRTRYAYRLKLEDDVTPTPNELFTILDEASADFAKYYYKKTGNIPLPENAIKKFMFEEYEDLLTGLISNWNKNFRHLKVDKFGKPIE